MSVPLSGRARSAQIALVALSIAAYNFEICCSNRISGIMPSWESISNGPGIWRGTIAPHQICYRRSLEWRCQPVPSCTSWSPVVGVVRNLDRMRSLPGGSHCKKSQASQSEDKPTDLQEFERERAISKWVFFRLAKDGNGTHSAPNRTVRRSCSRSAVRSGHTALVKELILSESSIQASSASVVPKEKGELRRNSSRRFVLSRWNTVAPRRERTLKKNTSYLGCRLPMTSFLRLTPHRFANYR